MNNGALGFVKKVGIACGAAIAAATIMSWLIGVAWREGTRPMVETLKQQSDQVAILQRRQFYVISALLDTDLERGRATLREEMRQELSR